MSGLHKLTNFSTGPTFGKFGFAWGLNTRIWRVVLVYDTKSDNSRSNNARLMHTLCKHAYFI